MKNCFKTINIKTDEVEKNQEWMTNLSKEYNYECTLGITILKIDIDRLTIE